ncbi:MAG: DUF853 family protein, partial [Oscillospiraceae bacterium]|nr:DUF853 family protein [Oscillospiraceae bacterium]
MKKVLALVMAFVMMLAVTGCSESTADDGVVTVGVIQFMQHASLDEAYQGFVDGLAEAGYDFSAYPTTYWDIYGEKGMPLRTTISEMGPLLLSRILDLNEVQSDI